MSQEFFRISLSNFFILRAKSKSLFFSDVVAFDAGVCGKVESLFFCIEAECESEMSACDGAAVVEVLMAGYLSAAKSDVVTLPIPR